MRVKIVNIYLFSVQVLWSLRSMTYILNKKGLNIHEKKGTVFGENQKNVILFAWAFVWYPIWYFLKWPLKWSQFTSNWTKFWNNKGLKIKRYNLYFTAFNNDFCLSLHNLITDIWYFVNSVNLKKKHLWSLKKEFSSYLLFCWCKFK